MTGDHGFEIPPGGHAGNGGSPMVGFDQQRRRIEVRPDPTFEVKANDLARRLTDQARAVFAPSICHLSAVRLERPAVGSGAWVYAVVAAAANPRVGPIDLFVSLASAVSNATVRRRNEDGSVAERGLDHALAERIAQAVYERLVAG